MKNNVDIKTSYTAADSIPLKVLLDRDLMDHADAHNKLLPIHIQILPTNRCNMNCDFCSCAERDIKLELDLNLAKRIIHKCAASGTKAVTITGGGEPLLYRHFKELIDCFESHDIKMGLVSNGLLLPKTDRAALAKITWCRISNDDKRTFSSDYREGLKEVVSAVPDVDWAFSHVVSETPNFDEIGRIIDFANTYNFTHVRLVADLFQPEDVDMDLIRAELVARGIDDSKVVYQGRKAYQRGGECYIGFIKPLIGPDAKVYACCGVQYALESPSRDLPPELCLGDAIDIDKIMDRSDQPLDGGICAKCYYMNYNTLLRGIVKNVVHKEFV